MNFYVATKWEDRDSAKVLMDALVKRGHHITYDWTVQGQESAQQAIADLQGVLSADYLVVLAEHNRSYRGVYVELGFALAAGKPVLLVGDGLDECLFTRHPLVSKVALKHIHAL